MNTLNPSRIRGFKLPHSSKRLTHQGKTTILYSTDNLQLIEAYTIELVKVEWLYRGLAIINGYEYVGEAIYTGYDYNRRFHRLELPVYRYYIPRLQSPNAEQKRTIRRLRKQINALANSAFSEAMRRRESYSFILWERLYQSIDQFPLIDRAIEFIRNYDLSVIHPDFGLNDFMIWKGEITCIDPFHHANVNQCIRLTKGV